MIKDAELCRDLNDSTPTNVIRFAQKVSYQYAILFFITIWKSFYLLKLQVVILIIVHANYVPNSDFDQIMNIWHTDKTNIFWILFKFLSNFISYLTHAVKLPLRTIVLLCNKIYSHKRNNLPPLGEHSRVELPQWATN